MRGHKVPMNIVGNLEFQFQRPISDLASASDRNKKIVIVYQTHKLNMKLSSEIGSSSQGWAEFSTLNVSIAHAELYLHGRRKQYNFKLKTWLK